jgi:hypothetical protein
MSRAQRTLSIALVAVSIATSTGLHAAEGPSPIAAWGVGGFGERIGLAGIVTAGAGAQTEIYVSAVQGQLGSAFPHYWYALRYAPDTKQYEQVFLSESFSKPIVKIALVHTPVPDRPLAIAVAFEDSTVKIYDQATKQILGTYTDPCSTTFRLTAFTTKDVNGDGWDEFLSQCWDGSLAVHGFNYATWKVPGLDLAFGGDIAVGQMDDDASLEIAVTDGRVIDVSTHLVEWTWPAKFGIRLQAADVDADGRDELIAAEGWYVVWAYDVERRLPKWSVPTDHDIDSILVTDIDSDGVQELLIGDDQSGGVHAISTQTLTEEWKINHSLYGVPSIAVADVNNDGAKELLFTSGAGSSGSDRIFVANWSTRSIIWQNLQLDGNFLGPELGDLDGDGSPEFVFVSASSEAGYQSGRIVVLDGQTLRVRAISPAPGVVGGMAWSGVNDFKLRDLNRDGRPEIVVAASYLHDGVVEAYSFSPANVFTLTWTNATRPYGASFRAVDVADVDGDGNLEVIASVGIEHSGAVGEYAYVYDVTTHLEEWKTLQIGGRGTYLKDLVVTQMDGDPALELAVMIDGGAVWVVDGITHALEAIIDVKASAISTLSPGYGIGSLLIGQTTGRSSAWAFNGAGYSETVGWNLSTQRIDGLELTGGVLFVGTGGVIKVLREGSVFQTANYGIGFGRSILSIGNTRVLFSGGAHGVHAFIVRP